MLRSLYKLIFKRLGWVVTGALPDIKKYIIIVAPHTSNWDFIMGVIARGILNPRIKYLGKKELFRPPYGWLFKWLGGYPVDRSKSQAMVDTVVEIFRKHSSFFLALAPEGTRSRVTTWRTGFYHMAVKAGVPIIMISLDYYHRELLIRKPFYPSGDIENDLPFIRQQFEGIRGKNHPRGK